MASAWLTQYPPEMNQIFWCRHRFPAAIIQHVIWLYFRFTPSYRDVGDLLAERDMDVSYETVRRWRKPSSRSAGSRCISGVR
jgi:transposase-like protein